MKRSAPLVLLAIAATLTASACASRSVATRSGPRVVQGRDTVLVRIGDQPITRADVQARLEEIPEAQRAQFATPQGRQQLLDRMIEERVWLEMAAKHGVPERPQIRQQIEQQRRDLLIRTWLQEVMSANPAPSDSDARVYYDSHAEEYRTPATVTLRHIQLAREAEARRVFRLARRGDDWERLVTRHSTDTLTKSNGGLLGTVTREGMFTSIGRQPAIAESAMALGSGKIGGPWQTDRGWHVVRVDEVKAEAMRPFETVRPLILRQLGSQRAQEFYRRKLEEARQELKVTADSTALQGFLHQKKSARDMFREAQELGPPQARIEAYEAMLAEHPDADVSPQARFMIGFIYSEELKDYEQADRHFRLVLSRYPNSELAASAKWMIENMRTEDAPTFAPMEADSNRTADAPRGSSGKP
jgi:peptidyl-prolyl cis-trans isomerase C